MVGWTIVVSPEDGETKIHLGRTVGSTPVELIMTDLDLALQTVQDPVWISVPKKRRGLAASLRNAGFSVSVGLGVGSRAEPELREQIALQTRRFFLEASQADAIPPENRAQKQGLPEPFSTVYWLPTERRIAARANCDMVQIATDASVESAAYSRLFAAVAVSDQGDCVLDSGFTQTHSGEIEFLAIIHALELVVATAPRNAVIMSDSVQALTVANWLSRGAHHPADIPEARNIEHTVRSRFERAWWQAHTHTEVTLEHVMGHSGHPLNEAADAIARTARRAATVPELESSLALTELIERTLATASTCD
ncbi:ribonuclease HI [Leucobacter chromiireducens]|uniref:ribonuclease HI n=1 Tax=Leucobacter chromiireducens TaxID=283877 RepID=UPI0013DDF2E1|nr:RNase H family protein [Leucobacter chromiireducens]